MGSSLGVQPQVILVDAWDQPVGVGDKWAVHQYGWCHRAYSVFIFRRHESGEWECLLQQRADSKYHSAGLWSNTCCSHPAPGEQIRVSAMQRLQYEMGVDAELIYVDQFHYCVSFDNGLIENEMDSVFIGIVDGGCSITVHPEEVQAHEWVAVSQLQVALKDAPHQYTAWLDEALSVALLKLED